MAGFFMFKKFQVSSLALVTKFKRNPDSYRELKFFCAVCVFQMEKHTKLCELSVCKR